MKRYFEFDFPDEFGDDLTAEEVKEGIDDATGFSIPGLKVTDITQNFIALVKTHVSLSDTNESLVAQLVACTGVSELVPLSDREDKETLVHCWGCNITKGISDVCNCLDFRNEDGELTELGKESESVV